MLQTDRTPTSKPVLLVMLMAALALLVLVGHLEQADNDAAEKIRAAECADIQAGVLPAGYRNDCPALAAGEMQVN